jgi:hypothetical protein
VCPTAGEIHHFSSLPSIFYSLPVSVTVRDDGSLEGGEGETEEVGRFEKKEAVFKNRTRRLKDAQGRFNNKRGYER